MQQALRNSEPKLELRFVEMPCASNTACKMYQLFKRLKEQRKPQAKRPITMLIPMKRTSLFDASEEILLSAEYLT